MTRKKSILITITLVLLTACSGQQVANQSEKDTHQTTTDVERRVQVEEERGLISRPQPVEIETSLIPAADQVVTLSEPKRKGGNREAAYSKPSLLTREMSVGKMPSPVPFRPEITPRHTFPMNTESYTPVTEMGYINTKNDPLSTFSIDVDTASYSNIRRFVTNGTLPPMGAVRIEEMINYFSYAYPQPQSGPFSVNIEVGPSPWHPEYRLAKIGLKARDLKKKDLPASNLVFLIDVSGSMRHSNKLPLLKKSMKMLVSQLEERDRVAIVVYAGTDRIILQPTSCDNKDEINKAIDHLISGGSTHGSKGIITAYQLAEQTLMPNGNNRIILASDGDFNVGVTTRGELTRLIEEKRKSGIYLTVLGFGMGNYHDDTMEILADKGNGNYAYIDTLLEAKKVMVQEMGGTMFAMAKDVKIQVEFNPAMVGAYRLIGYENRALADEDFNDDKKDAGEIGVGHTVTALYEIIPPKSSELPRVDSLKYQKLVHEETDFSKELLTVKLRYKPLDSETSLLIEQSVSDSGLSLRSTSGDFRFAAAVAAFGMELKGSEYINGFSLSDILKLARGAKGADAEGYRAEFIRLVEMSELLN